MLNIFCDVQHLLDVPVEGVERVEHGTCDNLHCRRAAAVSVVRAGSIIRGVKAALAEAMSSSDSDEDLHRVKPTPVVANPI